MKLSRVIEGVLFNPLDNLSKYPNYKTRHNPLYIVNLTTPADTYLTFANCFAIDKASLKHYSKTNHTEYDASNLTKAHRYYKVIDYPYGKHPKSALAKLANAIYLRKPRYYIKTIVNPPLFTSIISKGTDTFTGKQERVICEREPSKIVVSGKGWFHNKHSYRTSGDLTGVKFGLSSFLPIRTYTPKNELLGYLKSADNKLLQLYLPGANL